MNVQKNQCCVYEKYHAKNHDENARDFTKNIIRAVGICDSHLLALSGRALGSARK